eukprot:3055678-Rhodomonas_salina.1
MSVFADVYTSGTTAAALRLEATGCQDHALRSRISPCEVPYVGTSLHSLRDVRGSLARREGRRIGGPSPGTVLPYSRSNSSSIRQSSCNVRWGNDMRCALRALRDFNLGKLVADDVGIFM